jgi:hypothetical protein
MIAYGSANLRNRILHVTREVMEETNKQSHTRLTKVKHLKGCDAKPLV